MALKMCKMWSNGIIIAFFQKITKNRPAAGGSPPADPRLWYVWIKVHFFTHVSQFTHFRILTRLLV